MRLQATVLVAARGYPAEIVERSAVDGGFIGDICGRFTVAPGTS